MIRHSKKSFALLVVGWTLLGCKGASPLATPTTEDQKTAYAYGYAAGHKLIGFRLTEAELELVAQGVREGAKQRPPRVDLAAYNAKMGNLVHGRKAQLGQERQKREQPIVADLAKEPGTQTLPTGLLFTLRKEGAGLRPGANSRVRVNMEGRLADGTVFDSPKQRGGPAELDLSEVIPCLAEGLQQLPVGGKARLVCPPDTAYGPEGDPPSVPESATVIFELELLEILSG